MNYLLCMTEFRTKGRGKDRQVFPVSGGKEYRRVDDYEQNNPPDESPPEEKMQEQKAEKKHKLEKPSFSTRSDVRRDIKNMMRKDGSDEHGSKDYVNYRKKLDHVADRTYSKENRKLVRMDVWACPSARDKPGRTNSGRPGTEETAKVNVSPEQTGNKTSFDIVEQLKP